MYTYSLFCETVKCRFVALEAMAKFDCMAISPKQVQHTWKDGKMIDRVRDLLPGYLFLYSEDKLELSYCYSMAGVIRLLRTNNEAYELSGGDEAFAKMIYRRQGVLGKTPVYEEDQRIRLTEGAFAGLSAKILRVDHRARRMQIELPFAGRLVKTWVEYEITTPEMQDPLLSGEEKEKPDGE